MRLFVVGLVRNNSLQSVRWFPCASLPFASPLSAIACHA
ncbi:hypothetical protein RB13318 [Rhodopirellula baltica SH 1]|uniref:Uncharacterized protein n=1 Tax=Rhodopirellula baltica (strain DSM 10527 / NCIMB 13988 / SH1) TaxID=243090 RepID=Q7UHB7_RHOBA|nr:hypothetical protein RB13318 [Rhodopirellula baltica SH 1]